MKQNADTPFDICYKDNTLLSDFGINFIQEVLYFTIFLLFSLLHFVIAFFIS